MLKITFYPNDEARIIGSYLNFHGEQNVHQDMHHHKAESIKTEWLEQSENGTIEAQIVTIRKPGAYTIPKLDRVNDVFNQLTA